MKKTKEKESTIMHARCVKCGELADRRFNFESDHGFVSLCSSQLCYNNLVKDLGNGSILVPKGL